MTAIVAVCGSQAFTSTAPSDQQDTATLYLRAWLYKDYDSMRRLSAPTASQGAPDAQFYAAAGALPQLPAESRIVSRQRSGTRETVYFEARDPDTQAIRRGSFVIGPDGVHHPELEANLHAGASPAERQLSPQSVVRETPGATAATDADSILAQMEKAGSQMRTMRARVTVRGSFAGQTMNDTGALLYKAPDKFRMELRSLLYNANGNQSILFLPQANVYMDMAGLGAFELSPGLGASASELRSKYDVRYAGEDVVGGKPACKLLLKTTQNQIAGMLGASGDSVVWIDKKTWLPLRTESGPLHIDYADVQANAENVTDEQFVFTPPPGATALSMDSILGSLTGAGSGSPQ